MKIIYLCPSLKMLDGWSRYSHDVVTRVSRDASVVVFCHENDNSISGIRQECILRHPSHVYLSSSLVVLLDAWRIRRAIARECRSNEPIIVHAMAEGYAMFLPFLRGLPVRTLMTIHGTYSVLPLQSWKTRWLYRWMYRTVDRVIAVSGYTKHHLLKNVSSFMADEKVMVMTNGVDYRSRPARLPSPEGVFRLLTVGEVKHRKGGHHLVRVARILKERYEFPFCVTFVGRMQEDSAYVCALRAYIEAYDLKDHIQFVGPVSQEELDQAYRNADLFILLSVHEHGHYEGYPLVFHEAAMWGLPTIGTYDCGAEDAIADGVSGMLVHPSHHEEVADIISRIRSGDVSIDPSACKDWARRNDWDTKNLMDMYAFSEL